MLYSPRPHDTYLKHFKGPGAGLYTEPYWNLAWLTLPGIENVEPERWVKHPMEDSIATYVWHDLHKALKDDYPLAAVQIILDEGVDRITLCEYWEADTCDIMLARARESERRLRIADGTAATPPNAIYVDFRLRRRVA